MTELNANVLCEAQWLYNLGFNIMPIPCVDLSFDKKKPPYGEWGMLKTSRVAYESILTLFRGANLAVMTGRMSKNLFVIDCDSIESFKETRAQLKERGLSTWVRSSARGGHFWFLCNDGEVKSTKFGDIDILGSDGYVLAPPSIHPTGMTIEWLEQLGMLPRDVSLESLSFLSLNLTLAATKEKTKHTDLPPRAHQILILRDVSDFNTHSHAELIACQSLIAAGYSDNDIYKLFQRYRPPHFVKKKERRAWFDKYVLTKAHKFVSEKRTDISSLSRHDSLKYIQSWIENHSWKGRTGTTDRHVLKALIQRAQMDKSTIFRASIREISESANLGTQAVMASLLRLQGYSKDSETPDSAKALIAREESDKVSQAAQYRFIPENFKSEGMAAITTLNVIYPVNSSVVVTNNSHDAFHPKALGKSALLLWEILLAHESLTASELVEKSGKARRTVQVNLDKLALSGMAQNTLGRWEGIPATDAMLDDIANSYGTLGKQAAKARYHQREREMRVSAMLMEQRKQWESHNASRLLHGALNSE